MHGVLPWLLLAARLLSTATAQPQQPCVASIPPDAPWATCTLQVQPQYGPLPATSVNFTTADSETQTLFDHAVTCEAGNVMEFAPGFDVVVEGGHYTNVWLETQPMGGAMYGVRNMRTAVNNQLVFMRTQREDGRLPGMITSRGGGVVNPTYSYPGNANLSMLQGFYMASPAVDVAWLMNATGGSGNSSSNAVAYLEELQSVLERFEGWLWAARNSSDGVLWLEGTADTGEDGSDKYSPIPSNEVSPPFESMDMMGYVYDAERALARIALIQGNASAHAFWTARMAATAASLKARLWRPELGACFDRERDGSQTFVSTLVHNNIRAMWAGVFDQGMADAFVAMHLMNRSEFWTPTPLTSISASDPRFKDVEGNNWSGPPEGLTFQRALRALEFYGHHAEALLAGALQKAALLKTHTFPQQIDPFTSQPDGGSDCYGPMLLSMLEYTALTTGVSLDPGAGAVLFSAVATNASAMAPAFVFSQQLGGTTFQAQGFGNGTFSGSLNGALLFSCTGSARVVTDSGGTVTHVVGAGAVTATVGLRLPGAASPLMIDLQPNTEWAINGDSPPVLSRSVPFTLPF
jgi:hypothetical protein